MITRGSQVGRSPEAGSGIASPRAARELGRKVRPERLRDATFIGPIYSYLGQVIPGDDGCPLPHGQRRIGHETQTAALALELAHRTGQLVFAPAIAARPWVERGALVEIEVDAWDVREPLYLACDGERVRARVQRAILSALRASLRE